MKQEERRKAILINKSFQFKLIAKFIVVNIIILLIFGGLMFLFLNSEIESNLHTAHVTYNNVRNMLFPILVTLSIINIVISSIVIAGFVLFASHKLAGPIYRFTQTLDNMSKKDFSPFPDLRGGDQFLVFSKSLKKMSETVRSDMASIQSKIHELKEMNDSGNTSDLKRIIDELDGVMEQYKF